MASKFLNPYIDEIKKFHGLVFSDDECRSAVSSFKKPIHLDIGCGNGEALVYEASKDPDTQYVGVELQYKEVYRTALKIQKAGLKNCVIFKIDAKKIPELFPKGSMSGVNIFFPDPWPKTKQKKNRLVQRDYMLRLSSCLAPGSTVKIRTDNDDYFSSMISTIYGLIDDLDITVDEFTRDYYMKGKRNGECVTAFERIFLRQGLLINALYFKVRKPFTGNI